VIKYIPRFSRTERALHWANALGFLFLLATGLILYLPSLSILVARRPLMKDMHFWGGVGGSRCSSSSCCSATGAACCVRRASSSASSTTA
jgi:hypothetical protein